MLENGERRLVFVLGHCILLYTTLCLGAHHIYAYIWIFFSLSIRSLYNTRSVYSALITKIASKFTSLHHRSVRGANENILFDNLLQKGSIELL